MKSYLGDSHLQSSLKGWSLQWHTCHQVFWLIGLGYFKTKTKDFCEWLLCLWVFVCFLRVPACLSLVLTLSIYFSPRLICHLFSPYFSFQPFAAAVHTISYFFGCLLSFLFLFFLHLWLFLPFSILNFPNAIWCLFVGNPNPRFKFNSLEISLCWDGYSYSN